MANINLSEITSMLKDQIKNYKNELSNDSIGQVIEVGDGICLVNGLEKVMLNELVKFPNEIYGIAQSLETDFVGVIILGDCSLIKEGDDVYSTGKILEVPVGENFKGRIVDSLLRPIDGFGKIEPDDYFPVERKAFGVIDRSSVNEPLQTGIKVIDALVPIGRGQRELIIGDRQTGKTSIAVDTIINQKDKNVISIYVAIGQKESTIKNVYETLKKYDAMKNTIIVSASASNAAPMLYLAPYSGVALAEYFMLKGQDVLIVYDDLSKHAVAYRELSLLLHRPPGREAYPGDVFYLHSRLLERAQKLKPSLGGGSITALPIIETQAGDISAYIPTNVISITDGQIFLQADYFYKGTRPAINAGLSVSRVGGAAQKKCVKKLSGTLRLDLASFRELESFTQFGSDLDQSTKARLERGKRTVEILKQDLHETLNICEETIILYALTKGYLDKVQIKDIRKVEQALYMGLKTNVTGQKICAVIEKTNDLPNLELLDEFVSDTLKKTL